MSFRQMFTEFVKVYEDRFNNKYKISIVPPKDYQLWNIEKIKEKISKDISRGKFNRKYKVNGWQEFKEIGIFVRDNYNINIKPLLKEINYYNYDTSPIENNKKEEILYICL